MLQTILTLAALFSAIIMPLYAIHRMNQISNRIPSIDDFCEIKKNEKGEPEVFIEPRVALILDGLIKRAAQTFFQSSKMSMLQGIGANAKLDKGLKSAFAKDIIDKKIPILSIIGDFAGINVKQYIAKNPDAFLNLLSDPRIQKLIGGVIPGQHNSPGQPVNYSREE